MHLEDMFLHQKNFCTLQEMSVCDPPPPHTHIPEIDFRGWEGGGGLLGNRVYGHMSDVMFFWIL